MSNPLNLSLSGSQISKVASARQASNSRRPPTANTSAAATGALSQRSFLSSSTNNLAIDSTKKTDIPKNGLNSGRAKPKMPVNPWLKKNDDKVEKINKESNIFTPMSVRSSTDEFESLQKMNDFKKIRSDDSNTFDLFFKKNDTNGQEKNGSEINYKAISPAKDEKIAQLQTSVDHLRKVLHMEDLSNKNETLERIERTKRKMSALKIQTWYRKHLNKSNFNRQEEIEKLFAQKKLEMKKKMEKTSEKNVASNNSNYFVKKSPKSVDQLLTRHEKRSNQALTFLKETKTNSSVTPRTSETSANLKASINVSNKLKEPIKKEIPNEPDLLKASTSSNTTITNNNNNVTVESLLLSLDKIEKESESLLQFEKSKPSSNQNDIASSGTSEKINSIFAYLDEAASNNSIQLQNSTQSYTPKHLKDYKYELAELSLNAINKSSPPNTPPSKTKSIPSNINSNSKKTSQQNESLNTERTNRQNGNTKATNSRRNSIQQQQQQQQQPIQTKQNDTIKQMTEEELDQIDKSMQMSAELNNKIMTQKFEIEEKKRKIAILEKTLDQQRELTIRHTQEADREMQIRLEAQKSDYESTIQRHLGFIDQLIEDKKMLSEKCEKLVKELKEVEKTYSDRLRNAEERFKFESQKLKDTFEAAEKIRREKWIDDKTKKIKEMTVKGLEPEIQGLITKHKNELKTLKSIHDAELLQADERAAQRYIRITEELRENYEREKEASIQKERDIAKQRYEKSLEDEEKSFLEQRRRLYAEIEEEKNRIAEQGAFQRREFDRLKKTLEENNFSSIEKFKKEYDFNKAELDIKHQNEIKNLKEQLDIEKQSWEQNYLKKQENWVIQKERELKEQIKRERDKEIELLISRLESETASSREEADRTAENRIKRIRDKYESELKEVEKTERETMERYNNLKAKFNELEGEHERLKVVARQKEKDLEGIKKLTDVLQDERNRLADVLRQDFSDRIVFTEEENKRIKMEMVELKSRHQYDLDKKKEEFERLQNEKTEELNSVHEKIKQVVTKKDEAFAQLKQQYDAACRRADHLEGLLEQSRNLMLKKQTNSN